jgi:hypothetical protein
MALLPFGLTGALPVHQPPHVTVPLTLLFALTGGLCLWRCLRGLPGVVGRLNDAAHVLMNAETLLLLAGPQIVASGLTAGWSAEATGLRPAVCGATRRWGTMPG